MVAVPVAWTGLPMSNRAANGMSEAHADPIARTRDLARLSRIAHLQVVCPSEFVVD